MSENHKPVWEECRESFLRNKKTGAAGSTNTDATYRHVIDGFMREIEDQCNGIFPAFDQVEPRLIEAFIHQPVSASKSKLKSQKETARTSKNEYVPPSRSTIYHRLVVLGGFFDTAIMNKLATSNYARNYLVINGKVLRHRTSPEEQSAKALNKVEKRAFFSAVTEISKADPGFKSEKKRQRHEAIRPSIIARNELIFYLFEATGVRREGMLGMLLHNVDLDSMTIVVKEKGNKFRTVPVFPESISDDDIEQRLRDWIGIHRPALENSNAVNGHMFISDIGKPISRDYIQTLTSNAMKLARLDKPYFGPHLLRHTFTTDKLDSGQSPRDVAKALGHAGLGTITTYDSSKQKQVIENMRVIRQGNKQE